MAAVDVINFLQNQNINYALTDAEFSTFRSSLISLLNQSRGQIT